MPELTAPVPITEDHDLSAFDCGKPPLDEFLKLQAYSKQNARLSRTYVVTPSGSAQVVAYYTLAHVTISQEEAPKKMGRGMPSSIPALLLARLAVDRNHQGMRIGSSLFSDALRRTWSVIQGSAAPVRLFVVDAKDEQAREFYEKHQMLTSPVNPMRLFLSYKDIQAIFA